jgi:hypothetical protein
MASHYFPFRGAEASAHILAGGEVAFHSRPIASNDGANEAARALAKATGAVLR